MHLNLTGKRALVSGSTSGIGAATVKALASSGASVVVHGRDAARAGRIVAEITAAGGTAFAVLGDTGSDAEVAALAATVNDRLGGIDILVNNAADSAPYTQALFAFESQQWLDSYNRNVVATLRMTSGFVGGMRQRGWGRIINIGSTVYTQPTLEFPAYSASKAALANLTVTMARVLKDTGVTVNILNLGGVVTETLQSNMPVIAEGEGWPETDLADIERRLAQEKWPNLAGRLGRPEEIAAAIVFLASESSGYVTASNLRIDGGMTGWMY